MTNRGSESGRTLLEFTVPEAIPSTQPQWESRIVQMVIRRSPVASRKRSICRGTREKMMPKQHAHTPPQGCREDFSPWLRLTSTSPCVEAFDKTIGQAREFSCCFPLIPELIQLVFSVKSRSTKAGYVAEEITDVFWSIEYTNTGRRTTLATEE